MNTRPYERVQPDGVHLDAVQPDGVQPASVQLDGAVQPPGVHRRGRWAATGIWAAGLAVALAAAIATAHGLYEVVRASGAPSVIAALYPLITDGLALVAYAATTRLAGHGRRYAWTIVVAAASLSGLAQAVYMAGGVHTAPGWLRAGVGGWPAIAAAIVAHLLYLLGTSDRPVVRPVQPGVQPDTPVQPEASDAVQPASIQPAAVQPSVQLDGHGSDCEQPGVQQEPDPVQDDQAPVQDTPGSARDRAREVARAHADRYGDLPTVSELVEQADVARGTAGTVLKQLRSEKPDLQIIHADTDSRS